MRTGWVVVALALAAAGCGGHRRMLAPDSNTQTREGVLSVWADWVVDKGDKFDVELNLQNRSDRTLVLFSQDITGARGTTPGVVKHGHFGLGERAIDLSPGQLKTFTFVCVHGKGARGDFSLRLGKIFDNPSNDRKTPGDVMAEGLEWRLPESAAQ
jgi:hypothetical protein